MKYDVLPLPDTLFSEATMRGTIYLHMFNIFGFPQLKEKITEVSKQDGAFRITGFWIAFSGEGGGRRHLLSWDP
jgi:hypothetical protein